MQCKYVDSDDLGLVPRRCFIFLTEKVLESNHNPSDLGLGAHKSPGKNTSDLGLGAQNPMSLWWPKS